MSIPGIIDTQNPLSRYGEEAFPRSVILKSALWTFFLKNKHICVREFEGERTSGDILVENVDFFSITSALNSLGEISETKLWIWFVEQNNLFFMEIEPFHNAAPVLGLRVLMQTGVIQGDFLVNAGSIIKGLVIEGTAQNPSRTASYKNYPSGGTPANTSLQVSWPLSRLDEVSILIKPDTESSRIQVSFLEKASPPNINLVEIPHVAGDAVFFIIARGIPQVEYQWLKGNQVNPAERQVLLGETANTLRLTTPGADLSGTFYSCRVRNVLGTVFSNLAELTVVSGG